MQKEHTERNGLLLTFLILIWVIACSLQYFLVYKKHPTTLGDLLTRKSFISLEKESTHLGKEEK